MVKFWESIKNFFYSIIYYIRVGLFLTFRSLYKWIVTDHDERKRLFFERWPAYIIGLVIAYLYISFIDYLLFDWAPLNEHYFEFFKKTRFDVEAFSHFWTFVIIASVYFFISLIFVRIYEDLRWAYKTGYVVFFIYQLAAYEIYWEILFDYLTSSLLLYAVLYFWIAFGYQFLEFGENLEEEYENQRVRITKEALSVDEGWYGNTQIDKKIEVEMDGMTFDEQYEYVQVHSITREDEIMTQVFGNFDDYGENPMQLLARYEDHLFNMYGIVQFSEERRKKIYDLQQKLALDIRQIDQAPETMEEKAFWISNPWNLLCPYLGQGENFFYFWEMRYWVFAKLRLLPFKYIWVMIRYGRIFKPRSVGEYEIWIPPAFNINWCFLLGNPSSKPRVDIKWVIGWKNRLYNYFLTEFSSLKRDWFMFRGVLWFGFSFKYYSQCVSLRKFGSKNYVFFKVHVYLCGHRLVTNSSEVWPYL